MKTFTGPIWEQGRGEEFCPRKCFTEEGVFELLFASALANQRRKYFRLMVSCEKCHHFVPKYNRTVFAWQNQPM